MATPLLFEAMGRLGANETYDVILFGRDAHKLELVKNTSEAIIGKFSNLRIQLFTSVDAESAIEGADFILNQIRAGELKEHLFDELFPRKFGIPGDESVGPGGYANALRTIPIIMELCKLIEKYAPEATLLNLTNPGGMIQYAITHSTSVHTLGVCNTPMKTIRAAADLIGKSASEVDAEWFGMHHFGWLLNIKYGQKELMPEVLKQSRKILGLGVDLEIIDSFKAIPCAYLAYYFHPDRLLAATEGRTPHTTAAIDLNQSVLKKMETWHPGGDLGFITKLGGKWYEETIVPTLIALAEKRSAKLILSLPNQGVVPFLPDNAVVELQVPVTNGEIGKVECPEFIPSDIKSMVMHNCTYEMMAVESIIGQDIEKAKRALLSNLMIQNFNQVKGILAVVWPEKNKSTFKSISYKKTKEKTGAPELKVPSLFFDEKAIEQACPPEEKFAVISMEIPWKLVKKRFPRQPDKVLYIEELDWYSLEAMERELPEIDAVVGIGGGMAIDAAKYVAWKRRIPMDAVPTITSVDACVTKSIAARAGGHVTYIGYIVPRHVYIDYPIIMNAPKRLNHSGVGDILCAHTALYDWKLAHNHQDEKYNPEAATAMQTWLEKIRQHAQDILEVNQQGVKIIMQAFEDISIICRRFGSSRPQEGSDHTFAYNAEYQTGKHFLHGELVALGTFVMANLQKNQPQDVKSMFDSTGLLWQPRDLGLSKNEFIHILRTLNWYQKNFGRRYSVLDEVKIDDAFIEAMVNILTF